MMRTQEYLYSIQSNPYLYYAGSISPDLWVFIVTYIPMYVGIIFDRDGKLLEVQERMMSKTTREQVKKASIHDALSEGDSELVSWLQELDFREEIIRVQRFFLSEYHIGIVDFPKHYQKVLLDPSQYDEDQRELAKSTLARWFDKGLFELWLNNEENLWIGRDGLPS